MIAAGTEFADVGVMPPRPCMLPSSSFCVMVPTYATSLACNYLKTQAGRTRMASYFETTSGHFGSLSEMTEVTQAVVNETESELT